MAAIGFVLSSEQFASPQLVEFAISAEGAGFDMVWASDHFHPWMDNQGHSGQAWVTLAAVGQRTRRVVMGTGVTCPSYRYNPAIVAQAFATLGLLYPGRVFLGVGSGEALNEKPTTGDWGDYDERSDRLVEAVNIIRRLWTGEWVTYHGKFLRVESAKLYDLPPQPVPLYIAAAGGESLRIAGKHGDGLITGAETALKPETRDALAEGAREAGKNPDQLTVSAELFVFQGHEEEANPYAELWRFIPNAWTDFVDDPDPRSILRRAKQIVPIEKVLKSWVVSPDPDKHIHKLQELIDAGVDNIFVHAGNPDQQRFIEFYQRDVLPHVRHEPMQLQVLAGMAEVQR